MVAAYRSSATDAGETGIFSETVYILKPAGVVSGDILLASFGNSYGYVLSGPSGWTRLGPGGSDPNNNFWWKLAGGSEPASYGFLIDFPSSAWCCIIAAYSGTDGMPVFSAAHPTAGASEVGDSVNSVTGSEILVILGNSYISVPTTLVSTPPAGFTERQDIYSTQGDDFDGGSASHACIVDKTLTGSGPTGDQTITISRGVSGCGISVLLASPGTGGGGGGGGGGGTTFQMSMIV